MVLGRALGSSPVSHKSLEYPSLPSRSVPELDFRFDTDDDPISYLLSRRFPTWKVVRAAAAIPRARPTPEALATLQGADAYEAELRMLPDAELKMLCDAERNKAAAEQRAEDDLRDQSRFFHQPAAVADIGYWSRATFWKLEEAVALSFGKAPEIVNWETLKAYATTSPFVREYGRTRELVLRAQQWQQLYDPAKPGFFLAWAKRNGVPYPLELEAAVVARGEQIADWKTRYDELRAICERQKISIDRLAAERAESQNRVAFLEADIRSKMTPVEKQLGGKERDSLLKLVGGMAVGAYRFDPRAARSDKIADIVADLETAGVPLDDGTVRKWLRLACELLPPADKEC
jgi:hypothetical protein